MHDNPDARPAHSLGSDAHPRGRLIEQLRFKFDTPRCPGWYRVGIVVVAILMVLLPAVYVGMIALTGYGVYWHITSHFDLIESKQTWKGKWLYFGPIVVGAILISFMLKPILARSSRVESGVVLTPAKEPFLFAFISKLCATLGAPAPRTIQVDCDVNASVGFHQGTSGFLGGRRILTIGLPLAADMNLDQLTGILSHEFGHLAQGAGLRLGFAIRCVSAWFGRVAFGQDEWDRGLAQLPGDWFVLGAVAGFFIRITRMILRGFAGIGLAMSSWFSRQMELHADAFEIRVSGSAGFEASTLRLAVLQAAANAAQWQTVTAWEERRLADDLPALIAFQARSLADENRARIEAAAMRSGHGKLASHPSPRVRIAAARHASRDPAYISDAPASVLFADFAATCREATLRHYQRTIGKRVKRQNLVPLDEAIQAGGKAGRAVAALLRYFQGLANILVPIPIPDRESEASRGNSGREEIESLRQQIVDESAEGRSQVVAAQDASSRLWRSAYAAELLAATVELDSHYRNLGASSAASCEKLASESQETIVSCRAALTPLFNRVGRRLSVALSLLHASELALATGRADALRTEARQLARAAAAMNEVLPVFELACRSHGVLNVLVRAVAAGDDGNQALQKTLGAALHQSWKRLTELRHALQTIPYPFDHGDGQMSLARHVLPATLSPRNLKGTYDAGHLAGDRFHALYFRTLGRLAEIGEEVEQAFGLDPLPTPPCPPNPVSIAPEPDPP